MASNYTNLGVQLMTTGEKAGTWGTLTNTNWNILEQIAGGYVTQALTDNGTVTLTKNDGTTGATLATRVIKLTGQSATITLGTVSPIHYKDDTITGSTSYTSVDITGSTSYTIDTQVV